MERLSETNPTLFSFLLLSFVIVILPSGIAWLLCRGTVTQILQAYGIWVGMLMLVLLLGAPSPAEAIGFIVIYLFCASVFVVPVLVLLLKLLRRLQRL